MREGLDSLRQQGFALLTPLIYTRFAELQAELGEVASAIETLDHTLAEVERSGAPQISTRKFIGSEAKFFLKSDHSNVTTAARSRFANRCFHRTPAGRYPTFVLHAAALSLARLSPSDRPLR